MYKWVYGVITNGVIEVEGVHEDLEGVLEDYTSDPPLYSENLIGVIDCELGDIVWVDVEDGLAYNSDVFDIPNEMLDELEEYLDRLDI